MNIMNAIVKPLEERIAAEDNAANHKYICVQDLLGILVSLLKRFCATGPTLSELLSEVDRVSVDIGEIVQMDLEASLMDCVDRGSELLTARDAITALNKRVFDAEFRCATAEREVNRLTFLLDSRDKIERHCPTSPDRQCHYTTQGGMVELRNGREVHMPEGHDPTEESYDNCIYCSQPEERK